MMSANFSQGVIGDSVFIQANAHKVWDIITDLDSIKERNPQCISMKLIGKTKVLRQGARTINVNKQGAARWITFSTVRTFSPEKEFSFRNDLNGMVWSFQLSPQDGGVLLTQTRDSTHRSALQAKIADSLLIINGGAQSYTQQMLGNITSTLHSIKHLAESA